MQPTPRPTPPAPRATEAAEPAPPAQPARPALTPTNRYRPPDWSSPATTASPSEPSLAEPAAEPAAEVPAEPPARPRRVPVDIDDDYFPARRPDVPGRQVGQVGPADPVAPAAAVPSESNAVPVWAVRAPAPAPDFAPDGPQFSSDLSLDPTALRAKVTIRSGASSVQVDEHRLRLRTWLRRSSIDWSDVRGFQVQAETVEDGFEDRPTGVGHLVAHTTAGPVVLAGTRRPMVELRYVQAVLEAYRIRAGRLANG